MTVRHFPHDEAVSAFVFKYSHSVLERSSALTSQTNTLRPDPDAVKLRSTTMPELC
jgi:hypothetical protein